MKKILTVIIASASVIAASAQVFRPEVVSGAVLGGVAGAIIGNNTGHGNSGRGALIGAATGLILGSAVGEANHDQNWGNTQVYRPRGPRPGYYRQNYRGDYRGDYGRNDTGFFPGMVLGGVTGAIIGNNSGRHNGGRGAVIGALAGGLLGAIVTDNQRVYDSSPRFRAIRRNYQPVTYVYDEEPAPVAQAPQQVTIINNYYGTSGSTAGTNSLFGR